MIPPKIAIFIFTFFTTFSPIFGQSLEQKIKSTDSILSVLEQKQMSLELEMEQYKLDYISQRLENIGAPSSEKTLELVKHRAFQLGYDEPHEQAAWVMHMILPDITSGNVSRTNDFREDELISTHSAANVDYWESGYDRGHLAPSADFRWSSIALSESYFLSNMSPQLPELNREKWAELENVVRDYVVEYQDEVIVITGPVLNDSLPKMQNEGRKNEVSIPKYYYKIIADLKGDTIIGIAFIMENKSNNYPVLNYATSIDNVEELTGLNFFPNLSDSLALKIESNKDASLFQTGENKGDAIPLNPTTLPKGKINTVQAKYNAGSKSCVCGTVVATKYSEKSGATFLNLDKKFPNQIFSVTIWKDDRTNFSYAPEDELYLKEVCITGKIELKDGIPTMNISNEKSIEIITHDIDY